MAIRDKESAQVCSYTFNVIYRRHCVIFEYESLVAHTRFVFFCVLFFLRVIFFLSRVPGFVLRFTSKFLDATICEGLRSPVPDPLELRWRLQQDGGQNKITRKRMALVEVGGKLNSY